MRKIFASLDIGSCSIKLIVGEIQKNKVNVLSCVDILSGGIKKGFIVNVESAEVSLKEAFSKTEEMIGIPIREVLVSVPCYNLECFMANGSVTITSEDKVIKHSDITNALKNSVLNKINNNQELVSLLPTKYIINDEETVPNPVGMVANKLTVNDVAVVIPKKNVEAIARCLERLKVKITDIIVSPLADYYAFKDEDMKREVGAIVNLGSSNTTVSIFNKGVLTSCEVIDIGSSSIDNDIAYIFKVSKKDATYLKEKLVVADLHIAQPSESMMLEDINGNSIKVSQYDVSAVALSRLNEIFNLIKKQINLLTKKEISYIIVTGGISELGSFASFIENVFGTKGRPGNTLEIGARHNKYSVALGMMKYYNSRLKMKNTEYSIFSLDEQEEFGGTHKKVNISDNSLLGKIYGYFFDN